MGSEPVVLPLQEYKQVSLHRESMPISLGETLWRSYGSQIEVEFPSPKTDDQWRLTSQGWVGYIPLSSQLHLSLNPKVDLDNLFAMLEYAYHLKSFRFLDGEIAVESLEDYYERLAKVLARRVLDRARKGFYRTYVEKTDRLPYIRGRLDVRHSVQRPWDVKLRCHYEEHVADIEDNQILAWTLYVIARSGMCTEDRALPTVRRAYRSLRGLATLTPFSPADCVGRLYNRLNDDYHPLHGLCRFFLDHVGPTHEEGGRTVLPFLVDMALLYELFVAEWLKAQPLREVRFRSQEKVFRGETGSLLFRIDLVLCDKLSDEVLCVLDTKYKVTKTASADDIAQVIAYAESKNCTDAVLIFPEKLTDPLDQRIGRIRVRSVAFTVGGDLEQAGASFLQELAVGGVLH